MISSSYTGRLRGRLLNPLPQLGRAVGGDDDGAGMCLECGVPAARPAVPVPAAPEVPGGELGETPTDCAVRETFEETGVSVEPLGLLGIYSDPGYIVAYDDHEDPSKFGEVRQEFEITLYGRPITGTPTVNDEASDVRWFTPEELPALDIHPRMQKQIGDYLAGVRAHVD